MRVQSYSRRFNNNWNCRCPAGENVVSRNIQWKHPGLVEPGVGLPGAPGGHVPEPEHPGGRAVGSRGGIHRRGDGAAAPGQPAADGGADGSEQDVFQEPRAAQRDRVQGVQDGDGRASGQTVYDRLGRLGESQSHQGDFNDFGLDCWTICSRLFTVIILYLSLLDLLLLLLLGFSN